MENDSACAAPTSGPSTARAIFIAFSRASLLGFGGMLPQMFHLLVQRKAWVSAAEFAQAQAFGQTLPGPALANMAIALGYRWAGVRGALAALAGMIVTPLALVIAIGYAYAAWGELPPIQRSIFGMSAAAAGLLVGMSLRTATPMARHAPAWLIALAAFVAIGVLRWSFFAVIAVLGPLSVWLAWRGGGRDG